MIVLRLSRVRRPRAALALALLAAGCTVGPDYRPPAAAVSEAWVTPVSTAEVDATWWHKLGDSLLDELVDAALDGNRDLAETQARLREARAVRDVVRGSAEPQAGLSATASRNRLSENGLLPVGRVPGLGPDLSLFDVGFDASWEIDLWGGRRRAIESAEARAEAAREAGRAVLIQVIAEVVRAYVDLRTAQQLRVNAIADARAQSQLARLVADRMGVGLASRFDLARAEAQARATAAAIPGFEGDAAAAAFRLALLLGQPPEALHQRLGAPAAPLRTDIEVSAGLRSGLLRRRPDIRLAERELAAATADVGVATAELFPRLSLLGGVGLQARQPGDLLSMDSLRVQFGPGLRWPIFSGGRIRSQIRAADARVDASLARYERSVLAALADSETMINRYSAARSARIEREAARAAAAIAMDMATRRYEAGEDDLTALLQSQAALTVAERLGVQAAAVELHQLAALYKALGGGWEMADDGGTG